MGFLRTYNSDIWIQMKHSSFNKIDHKSRLPNDGYYVG